MIEFRDFSFQYPQSQGPILENVNLHIQIGCLTLVAGPSGSGKSTLLRSLNGLVPHFTGGEIQGSLEVDGENPVNLSPAGMANKVGFVFQEPEAQFVFDIVEDEIVFALENRGIVRDEMEARLDRICEQIGLDVLRHRRIATLSGGEKQKVAIASALVLQPEILVLDEPSSQLDPAQAESVLALIVSLKDQFGMTIVIAEHRLERLLHHTERMIFLSGNGQIAEGMPQEILSRMKNVPPVIQISNRLGLSPLPILPETFPEYIIRQSDPQFNAPNEKIGSPSLQVEGLTVQYDNKSVLNDVSLTLHEGEILTLMGPNGSGKTTLLRAIIGVVPSTGKRRIRERDLRSEDLQDIIQNIAYLPQNPSDLLFADSVMDEMLVTLKNHDKPVDKKEIEKHLLHFGLLNKLDQYPRDLSVGERQRTALAAITIHDPPIILLDEPTRGMDSTNKEALREILKTWRTQGKSILVVTHDVEFAAQLADRVAILDNGDIDFLGYPVEAFTKIKRYRTQTAVLFPSTEWFRPEDIDPSRISFT